MQRAPKDAREFNRQDEVQIEAGENQAPDRKGAMREPTQKPSAEGPNEDLKQALQEQEETEGDWSKSR